MKHLLKLMSRPFSVHCIVIIQPLIVLQHLPLYLGGIYPCNKVFHVSSHKECWVCNRLWPDTDVSLLNISNSLSQVLRKLQLYQNSR